MQVVPLQIALGDGGERGTIKSKDQRLVPNPNPSDTNQEGGISEFKSESDGETKSCEASVLVCMIKKIASTLKVATKVNSGKMSTVLFLSQIIKRR
jgi:hypothetical protein